MPTIAPTTPLPLLIPVTMSVADAATLLAVTPRTVHRWITSGRLTGAKICDTRVIVTGQSVADILTASGLPAAVTA